MRHTKMFTSGPAKGLFASPPSPSVPTRINPASHNTTPSASYLAGFRNIAGQLPCVRKHTFLYDARTRQKALWGPRPKKQQRHSPSPNHPRSYPGPHRGVHQKGRHRPSSPGPTPLQEGISGAAAAALLHRVCGEAVAANDLQNPLSTLGPRGHLMQHPRAPVDRRLPRRQGETAVVS